MGQVSHSLGVSLVVAELTKRMTESCVCARGKRGQFLFPF